MFVTISETSLAQTFFQKIWQMKELPILDQNDCTKVLFQREMRAYLVKSEAEFQTLALKRYQEELSRKSQGSQDKTNTSSAGRGRGRGTSRGKRGGSNLGDDFSHNNSSGTKLGGSAESQIYQKPSSDKI